MSERLTNMEKYAIQGMLNEDLALPEIAKKIGKSEKTILLYIGKLEQKVAEEQQVNQKAEDKKLRGRKAYINKSEAGKKGRVTIMTKTASERGDESGKMSRGRSRGAKGAIFRIDTGETE